MIHSILHVKFMCFTVLFRNLSPGPLWSTSWSGTLYFILHTFLHPIIILLSQNMPIPLQPVLLQYEIMSSNPSLSLGNLSFTLMPHIHHNKIITVICMLASGSQHKGCSVPFHESLLVAQWRMRPISDFATVCSRKASNTSTYCCNDTYVHTVTTGALEICR